MTVDQAATTWETMLADANEIAPPISRRRAASGLAFGALRTIALLVTVALAILVLLPAMLAAQPTFLG